MLKLLFLIGVCFICGVKSREICYGDLGCFIDTYPFSGTIDRPIAVLPETPAKINTRFFLYTRRVAAELINANILGNNYDAIKQTKFIIHGFLDHGTKKWILDMKNALLAAGDFNVIVVDWSGGDGFPYTQATANTQVVGAEIAKLIKAMVTIKGAKIADFHLIGHSLGAHISGYAGERTPGLPKITGLDPAGPYFENTDPRVRLDPTDAVFVEAIHTDGTHTLLLGLGLMHKVGHVDYYPNGGKDQPECPGTSGKIIQAILGLITIDIDGITDTVACSHLAAIHYYTDSISNRNCKFTAYPCGSYDDFKAGKCLKCTNSNCNTMGFWSSPSKNQGSLYLNTQNPLQPSTCKQNYGVSLISNNIGGQGSAKGLFTISLETSTEKSTTEILDDSDTTFNTDSTQVRLVSLKKPLNNAVERIYVTYTRTSNILISWLYDTQWSFRYIEIQDGDRQINWKFCSAGLYISNTPTVFNRC